MDKNAKFLYKYQGVLWYEYKGRTYIVNPMLYTSTAAQHRHEQLCIDAEIEREEKCKERDMMRGYRYEDTAEYGLEMFFKWTEE